MIFRIALSTCLVLGLPTLGMSQDQSEPGFAVAEYWSCPKDQIPALEQAVDSIWGPLLNELMAEGKFISWGAAAPVKAFKLAREGEKVATEETEPDWDYVFSWYTTTQEVFEASWEEFISRLRTRFPDDPRPYRFCPEVVIVQYDLRTSR